jgi:hypothetical protein
MALIAFPCLPLLCHTSRNRLHPAISSTNLRSRRLRERHTSCSMLIIEHHGSLKLLQLAQPLATVNLSD